MDPTAIVPPLRDRLKAKTSPPSPSDGVSFAANLEVVFQPDFGLSKTYAPPMKPLTPIAPTTALLLVTAADQPSKSLVCPSEAVSSALNCDVVFQPPAGLTKI